MDINGILNYSAFIINIFGTPKAIMIINVPGRVAQSVGHLTRKSEWGGWVERW